MPNHTFTFQSDEEGIPPEGLASDLCAEAGPNSPPSPLEAASPVDWLTVSEEALAIGERAAKVAVRKAADEIYATVLESIQDYFADNARFNLASRLEVAEREAANLRANNHRLRQTSEALLEVAQLVLHVDDEWKALSMSERTLVEEAIAKATGGSDVR